MDTGHGSQQPTSSPSQASYSTEVSASATPVPPTAPGPTWSTPFNMPTASWDDYSPSPTAVQTAVQSPVATNTNTPAYPLSRTTTFAVDEDPAEVERAAKDRRKHSDATTMTYVNPSGRTSFAQEGKDDGVRVYSEKTVDRGEGEGRPWWHPLRLLQLLVKNWFLIAMAVLITLAWRFPNVGKEGGAIRSEYTINYGAIALIFLITGLTLSTSALYNQFKNWYSHLVTQAFSLLFFPAVVFAIVNIIRASNNDKIEPYILVGLMMMSILPTTVAANVTMTQEAEGNVESAIAECCIGQVLGIFLSPLFLQMFMSAPGWEFGTPVAEGGKSSGEGLKRIYAQVGKHMGLAIFLPMIVGQVVQNLFPRQTKWVSTTLRLAKVNSGLLLLLIWSIFCTQFDQDAFNLVSGESIALVVCLNLALYVFFTAVCLVITRLPFLPSGLVDPVAQHTPKWRSIASRARFGRPETTAICFCAAAKGLVVGSPILDILYGGMSPSHRAIISIPLVLYQGEQIALGQLFTYLFRQWNRAVDPYKQEGEME